MKRAFTWVVIAYAVAVSVAWAVAGALPEVGPVWTALWADLAATVAVFAFSAVFRNSSFYDPYWSLAPIVIVLYWAGSASADVPALRQGVVSLLVITWGLRLTWNWARGWGGLQHEDWRYVDLQEKTGRFYWLVSFSGIHVAPTLWVFLGCLSIFPAVAAGTREPGLLDLAGVIVTGTAIWLEAQADRELRAFRKAPERQREDVLESGLWSLSRHPNYLGEMGFWWGLYLFALAADPAWWWAAVGPLSITLMFRYASLPMIEARMLERRPAFARTMESTPMVLPGIRP